MHSIRREVARALLAVPHAYRNIAKDPSEFIASAIALNILWGAYMFFVEGFIVGFSLAAILSLRLSAIIWNTIFGPYARTMEERLGKKWHRRVRTSDRPYLLPFRVARWYLVATGISLISQVPIQAVAYPMAIYVFGHASWSGLLPLTLEEWTSLGLFLRNSWFPIAILFSPILGPVFSPMTNWLETRLKRNFRAASTRIRPRRRPAHAEPAAQKVSVRHK